MSGLRILVDNSVLRVGIIGEWAKQPVSAKWADTNISMEVIGMVRRPMPSPTEVERRAAIEALPTICKLADQGKLELCTYEELRAEIWKGKNKTAGTIGD